MSSKLAQVKKKVLRLYLNNNIKTNRMEWSLNGKEFPSMCETLDLIPRIEKKKNILTFSWTSNFKLKNICVFLNHKGHKVQNELSPLHLSITCT